MLTISPDLLKSIIDKLRAIETYDKQLDLLTNDQDNLLLSVYIGNTKISLDYKEPKESIRDILVAYLSIEKQRVTDQVKQDCKELLL